ncbi:hypothetical protein [Amaricoccus solimangrovi]|uniref:Uncharacterized protein n=1 Tax=Amaricoccus solimangrovi TaxID=2589815 RepID=A0A501WGZ6_9RHOB|nr:hypothetical protein [Amaricoccus solimangrovi]TPE49153.1 hypothetical protein FJM51_15900 [Amaricoccus solimangrovi]
MTHQPENNHGAVETTEEAEIQARREVVKRMLKVTAVTAAAPMAALLFDPRKARADASGEFG